MLAVQQKGMVQKVYKSHPINANISLPCILRRPVAGGAVLSGRWAPQWSVQISQ